jgi:tRNA U55 pseudouridine synthase TruB
MNNACGKSNLLEDFNGIILINKLTGTTSYDVIRRIKGVFF